MKIIIDIYKLILELEKIKIRGADKRGIAKRKNVDDIRMRKRGEGNHTFNEDGMSFPAMTTDNSDNLDLKGTVKKINEARIRRVISPVRERTRVTRDRVKIDRGNNFIIIFLI